MTPGKNAYPDRISKLYSKGDENVFWKIGKCYQSGQRHKIGVDEETLREAENMLNRDLLEIELAARKEKY